MRHSVVPKVVLITAASVIGFMVLPLKATIALTVECFGISVIAFMCLGLLAGLWFIQPIMIIAMFALIFMMIVVANARRSLP